MEKSHRHIGTHTKQQVLLFCCHNGKLNDHHHQQQLQKKWNDGVGSHRQADNTPMLVNDNHLFGVPTTNHAIHKLKINNLFKHLSEHLFIHHLNGTLNRENKYKTEPNWTELNHPTRMTKMNSFAKWNIEITSKNSNRQATNQQTIKISLCQQ